MFQQLISIFHNLTSEKNFIITGIFYILILNILPFIKIFDLFTFFAIYGCVRHLQSRPCTSKNKLLSIAINIILILEILNLLSYIFVCFQTIINELDRGVIDRLKYFIVSFFLVICYLIYNSIQKNPNSFLQIIKEFLKEYYQFFLLLICYIFITKAVITKHFFEHIAILVVISFVILISTNILNKKSSLFLEILGFSYLFFVSVANFVLYYKHQLISKNFMPLTIDNNMAIFIIFINIVMIILIFLNKKIIPEKTKIFLLILLTISLFIPDNAIFCFIFYLTSSIILPILIIYYKKLSIFHARIFFIILNLIMFMISLPYTVGRGGELGYKLGQFAFLNIVILLIITFVANLIARKKQAKRTS
jgi:hypothetical protein